MDYKGYQLKGFVYIKDENSYGYENPIICGNARGLLISKRCFYKKDEVAISVDGAQFSLKVDYKKFLCAALKTNSTYTETHFNVGKMTTLRGYPRADLGGYDYDVKEICLSFFRNGNAKTLTMTGLFKEPIVHHPARHKESYSPSFDVYAEISDYYLNLFL